MDFDLYGENSWSGDEIYSDMPTNFAIDDIFITQKQIDKELAWPPIKEVPVQKKESFDNRYPNSYVITESSLIIMLLIVLIIMSVFMCTTIKLMCRMLHDILIELRNTTTH
jgi:hypothetical protein